MSTTSDTSTGSSTSDDEWTVEDPNRTAFLDACSEGRTKDVLEWIQKDTTRQFINYRDRDMMYGTHLAAEGGHLDVLVTLYNEGCDFFATSIQGNTALHIAARSGQQKSVQIILQLANKEWTKVRLLFIASSHPSKDSILSRLPKDVIYCLSVVLSRFCVSLNKLLAMQNRPGLTALDIAMKNRLKQTIPHFLSRVTAQSAVSSRMGSTLHSAAENGCPEVCQALIDLGGDINKLNERGETPLYRACCSYPEAATTVKLLLSHKADPSIVAKCGNTAFDEATNRKYHTSAQYIKDFQTKATK